jgi:hypothetical protein
MWAKARLEAASRGCRARRVADGTAVAPELKRENREGGGEEWGLNGGPAGKKCERTEAEANAHDSSSRPL